MLRFLGTFLGLEGRKQVQNIIGTMAQVDPETMSQAQLIEMERASDKATQLFAKLKVDWQREENEAQAAERLVNITTAGAEEIQKRLAGATDDAQKQQLNSALELVVTRLEEAHASAQQERSEANDAKSLLDEAEAAARDLTDRLVKAKDTLKSGAREMQRATLHAEVEERRAETAAQVAGLRDNSGDNLHAALNAFSAQTQKSNERAEAARLKTDQLRKTTEKSGDGNPILAEVMKSVENSGSGQALSAAERLAILTGKPSPAALAAPASSENAHAS